MTRLSSSVLGADPRQDESRWPHPYTRFYPTFHLDGEPAKGFSHGQYLRSFCLDEDVIEGTGLPPMDDERRSVRDSTLRQRLYYSRAIIDVCFECLYENPAHRPTGVELKTRIGKIMRDAKIVWRPSDDWADFVPGPFRT